MRRRTALLALAAVAALAGGSRAQGRFPERPISLLVPFGPGGIADLVARAVAESMTKSLDQLVVVENRPSAGSIVASQAVATARLDGHTLLLMSNGNAVSVGLFKKLPYDTVRDFAPITTLGTFDIGVFVAANSRFATLRDAVASPAVQDKLGKLGTRLQGSTPAELQALLSSEIKRWGEVIRAARIEPE
ncbi:MAG: tripartite tricarboxylate transporter substrate-binding protein [Rubrivivax sp.]|nr:tripartite tricarboxylate transporter substrate-binding protein [Rubrivivax sp.]